jgi:hypothetical protein
MAFPFSTHNDLGGAALRSSYTMQSPGVGGFTLRELGKYQVSYFEPFGRCCGGKLIIVSAFHYTKNLMLPSRGGLLQEIHSLGLVYKLSGKHDPKLVKKP